jgi:heptosyltransferase-1
MNNSKEAPSNVLWIRAGAFGDILQAIARARLFKRKFPNAKLTMLARPEFKAIVEPQDCFDDFIYWDSKRRPHDFFRCLREVKARNFDYLVSVHNAGSAAFVSLFSNIPHRYGYNSTIEKLCYDKNVWEWFEELGIDKDLRDAPMVQSSDEADKYAEELLKGLTDKKLFCITYASKPQKIWPLEYWPEFIRPLLESGWSIILNGHGDIEKENNAKIKEAIGENPNLLDLTNKLNYDQMAAVTKQSSAAMGPDTGPLHLAALVGTPTFGLFGCTPSKKIGFTMPWFREVLCTCPDVGCWNYKCPLPCMSSLTPKMALEGFKKFEEELL